MDFEMAREDLQKDVADKSKARTLKHDGEKTKNDEDTISSFKNPSSADNSRSKKSSKS